MIFLPVLFHVFNIIFWGTVPSSQKPDPCEAARAGVAAAGLFAGDSLFNAALINVKHAFALDKDEHCVSFGKDVAGNTIASALLKGAATSGKVPAIASPFADLHNHPNNLPPDAGDFYGLTDMNKNNHNYKTRFVITANGMLYALLVTDTAAVLVFTEKHLRQPPAFTGGPPGFPVDITDEAREMKYRDNCTDEMVLAFILEKYNTGVALLKQNSEGAFKQIITTVTKQHGRLVYRAGGCL